MSIANILIEELSEKIVNNLVEIIETEKPKQDKTIQKICDQCIRYIKHEKVRQEDTEKSIEQLNQAQTATNEAFFTLLLGILHDDIDEEELTVEYIEAFAKSSLAKPFQEELNDFISTMKFINLSDYSKLEQVGLLSINKYSNSDNIIPVVWNLTTYVNPNEYIAVFQTFADRAKELYPEVFAIENFQGWIHSLNKNYEHALVSYLNFRQGIENDIEDETYHSNLSYAFGSIAACYLKLDNPEMAIESANTGLEHDSKSEEYKFENLLLCHRAKAFIKLNNNDLALADLQQVLSESPDNEDALLLMEELKK